MIDALTGNYKPEHLFTLKQSLELVDFYAEQLKACDQVIESKLKQLKEMAELPQKTLSKRKKTGYCANAPEFDVRAALFNFIGIDLTEIHGIGPSLALKLVAECGTDMSRWPTSKHFTSWLCLAPGNKISGGKILSSRTRRSSSRAAAHLRLAATTIGKSDTALGAFYRRLATRTGKAKAVTATARKIATLFYNALRYGMEYVDKGACYYEELYRNRVLGNLQRRAESLGFILQEKDKILSAEGVS